MSPDDYPARIRAARAHEVAIESPVVEAPRLSRRLGNTVLIKREDLQPVFSFKLRGAYNKIAQLSDDVAARGVICASAGNHAQGVALAARRRGIPATIVMPVPTPGIKVQAVVDLGGEAILHGDIFDAAYERARQLEKERGLTFVHPFDDPDVIAGQGTIGLELLRQCGTMHAVFVPVGGGGLIGGIAAYLKSVNPAIRIIGVEPRDAAAMHDSLKAGRRVTLERVGMFADGVAVRTVGAETFRLAQQFVDEVVLVDTDEICAAIQDIFEDTRAVPEPSGALAIAGIKRWLQDNPSSGLRLVAINSGANLNFDRLRHIAERADIGAGREALFAVEIPEHPGSFLHFCEQLGQRPVTEFNYRFQEGGKAHIFVGIGLSRDGAERLEIVASLRAAGYSVTDMTDNEVAKLHVRYMVGGTAPGLANERLYRFEFPERPGALLRFLQAVGGRRNISLFHYRNHGSDYGRVFAGIQVPPAEREQFARQLDALHFPYSDESDNPAYRLFLGTDV